MGLGQMRVDSDGGLSETGVESDGVESDRGRIRALHSSIVPPSKFDIQSFAAG
jgi:hypothetical protein